MGSTSEQVPVINFSGLDPEIPGGERWDAARAEVMAALESFRCFEALYDGVSQELRKSLFGDGTRDLFGLPLATKKQNKSVDLPQLGYNGHIPNMDYESLIVDDPDSEDGVRRFVDTMWPEGNPRLCNTVRSFGEQLTKLERMVMRMIMESFGIKEDLDSLIRSMCHKMVISKNKVFEDEAIVFDEHLDSGLFTIDCQHIEGLEVQTDDGDWIPVHPLPNSFTILIGESMEAWSNGRLRSTNHRVRMRNKELIRYSAAIFLHVEIGKEVLALKELIDDEHPVLFKPFYTADYINFKLTGTKLTLKDFCGVDATTQAS